MEKYILVVDDDIDNCLISKIVLNEAGYKVQFVETVQAAIEKITKNPPQLVLLDYMLPDIMGIALLEYLKEDLALAHIPVIMVTAYKALNKEELNPQPEDFMFKPIRFEKLLESVTRLLNPLQPTFHLLE